MRIIKKQFITDVTYSFSDVTHSLLWCHSRAGGNPCCAVKPLDSRLCGNDIGMQELYRGKGMILRLENNIRTLE